MQQKKFSSWLMMVRFIKVLMYDVIFSFSTKLQNKYWWNDFYNQVNDMAKLHIGKFWIFECRIGGVNKVELRTSGCSEDPTTLVLHFSSKLFIWNVGLCGVGSYKNNNVPVLFPLAFPSPTLHSIIHFMQTEMYRQRSFLYLLVSLILLPS